MLREFTKAIGRYGEGEVHDYPVSTWNRMAASAKQPLDKFTRAVDINQGLQNPLRGPIKARTRLGSTH